MRSDKELYKKLQSGCLSLAKDFDRKILAGQMLTEMKNI
jgi:hypothetical protein